MSYVVEIVWDSILIFSHSRKIDQIQSPIACSPRALMMLSLPGIGALSRCGIWDHKLFVTSFLVCLVSDCELLIWMKWAIYGHILTGNARLSWNMSAVCKFLLRQFLPGSEVDGSVGVGFIRIRQRTCFIESVMYWGYFGGLNFNFPRLRKVNQLLPVHPEPWWSYAIFWSCTTWNWSTLQMWGMRPQVRQEQVFVTSILVCFISDCEVLIVINWEIHGGSIVTGNARLSWNLWLSQDAAGTFSRNFMCSGL